MAAKDDQVKLRKRLENLLKLPDNLTCADCRKRGPRWASANLGIFICIECSGIHRNLGVHISFVRSVNLDSWTKAQVDFMEEWGNKRANDYWEANVPHGVIRPKEGDPVRVVERFIRDKYEFKKYVAKQLPPPNEKQDEQEDHHHDSAVARRPSKHHSHHTHHHGHGHHEKPAQAAAPAAAQPSPVPAKVAAPAPSLLDFDEPVSSPMAAAPVAAAPAAAPQPQADLFGSSQGGFDAFGGSQQPAQQQQQGGFPGGFDQNNAFGNFQSPPAGPSSGFDFVQQQQQFQAAGQMPPQPPRPQASADAILSLYSSNMMNRGGPPMPMGGGFGGPMPTNMGYPPQQPPMMNVQPRGQPMMNAGYPPQQGGYPNMGGNPQYPMGYNGPAPVNPFGQQQPQQMPMPTMGGFGGGYPQQQPNYQQQQYQQPPVNPFRPGQGGMPNQPNMQYQNWQR